MRFVRPQKEIEAMPIRDNNGTITSYCVDFLDGKETYIYTAEELAHLGFRMLNGQTPGKKRNRKAPVLLNGEAGETQPAAGA